MRFASKCGVRNRARLNERIIQASLPASCEHCVLVWDAMPQAPPPKCGQPRVLSYGSYIASSGVCTGIQIASISISARCAPCALFEVATVDIPRLSGATW